MVIQEGRSDVEEVGMVCTELGEAQNQFGTCCYLAFNHHMTTM